MSERSIIWQPIEVDSELDAMKLDRSGLLHSIEVAAHERSFVTANDASGFGSYLVYAKMGRALRDWYLPKGWVKDNSNNQCAIKHPDLKLRIVP